MGIFSQLIRIDLVLIIMLCVNTANYINRKIKVQHSFHRTVINKPKEIAHLIKNKFGSADNIKELAGEEERDEERVHHGSATLPVGASLVPPTSTNQGGSLPR